MLVELNSGIVVLNNDMSRDEVINSIGMFNGNEVRRMNFVDIDEHMVETIITLNKKGYVTTNCCSGHLNDVFGYIAFRDPIFLCGEVRQILFDTTNVALDIRMDTIYNDIDYKEFYKPGKFQDRYSYLAEFNKSMNLFAYNLPEFDDLNFDLEQALAIQREVKLENGNSLEQINEPLMNIKLIDGHKTYEMTDEFLQYKPYFYHMKNDAARVTVRGFVQEYDKTQLEPIDKVKEYELHPIHKNPDSGVIAVHRIYDDKVMSEEEIKLNCDDMKDTKKQMVEEATANLKKKIDDNLNTPESKEIVKKCVEYAKELREHDASELDVTNETILKHELDSCLKSLNDMFESCDNVLKIVDDKNIVDWEWEIKNSLRKIKYCRNKIIARMASKKNMFGHIEDIFKKEDNIEPEASDLDVDVVVDDDTLAEKTLEKDISDKKSYTKKCEDLSNYYDDPIIDEWLKEIKESLDKLDGLQTKINYRILSKKKMFEKSSLEKDYNKEDFKLEADVNRIKPVREVKLFKDEEIPKDVNETGEFVLKNGFVDPE